MFSGNGIHRKTQKEIKFKVPDSISNKGLETLMKNVFVLRWDWEPEANSLMQLPQHNYIIQASYRCKFKALERLQGLLPAGVHRHDHTEALRRWFRGQPSMQGYSSRWDDKPLGSTQKGEDPNPFNKS